MKRGLLAITLLVPLALHAQDAAGVDELRSQLRNQPSAAQSTAQQAAPTVIIRNVSAPTNVVAAPNTAGSGSVAQQSADSYKSNSYQTQPTTLVEDAPYQDSKASAVRKKRQTVEDQTENKIVEKLETERMKDEERRANKILSTMDTAEPIAAPAPVPAPPAAVVVVPAPAPAPVVVAAPTPAPVIVAAPAPVVQAPREESRREESRTDIEDVKIQDKTANRWYVGGLGGVGEYPGVDNVRGKYAVGFVTGITFPDRLILEAGYTYSRFDVDSTSASYGYPAFSSPYLTQMNQSNVSLGLKWQVIETRVRPVVGALLDYTHRSYTPTINGQSYNSSYNNNGPTSNAFDAGFLIGLDVVLTDSVTVGVDWRYMMNLTSSSDSPGSAYGYGYGYSNSQPIEQLSYYMLGLNARFAF